MILLATALPEIGRNYRARVFNRTSRRVCWKCCPRARIPETGKTATRLGVHIGDGVLRLQEPERFSPIRGGGPSVKPEHLFPRTDAFGIHDNNEGNF